MKRFAWLWSAIAGAIVLPLATSGCALLYLGWLWNVRDARIFSLLEMLTANPKAACVGAVLGVLSGAFWNGRSFISRALGAGIGVAVTVLGFVLLWRRLETPVHDPNLLDLSYLPLKQEFLLLLIKMASTFLWAWTLVFAAPFVRSSKESPRRELSLWTAAGAVAGAVLLLLMTLGGVNFYLLQTGQDRLWVGRFVSLFWLQLPFAGAVFGVLSVGLWRGQRPFWLRGAGAGFSLVVTAWVVNWARMASIISSGELLASITVPTTVWALALFFFSLVTRACRDVFQPGSHGDSGC